MSGIEGVVRPFQTEDIGPPRIAPSSDTTDSANAPTNVIINPGKGGNVKTFSGNFNLTITFYYIKRPREKRQGE